jgi:hypothetical protein
LVPFLRAEQKRPELAISRHVIPLISRRARVAPFPLTPIPPTLLFVPQAGRRERARNDAPDIDRATLIKSIKDKLLPLGDDVGFICGHGPGSRIGHERMTNLFLTGAM